MKKLNLRDIKKSKKKNLQMLTCYDFQTASLLNETDLDMVLVGDSVGNVILGYETTVEVTLTDMEVFGSAVRRGAPDKFLVVIFLLEAIQLLPKVFTQQRSSFRKLVVKQSNLKALSPIS